MASFEVQPNELCEGLLELGELDLNANMPKIYKDGIVNSMGIVVSPGHLFHDLLINLLTSLCNFVNDLSPVILKIIRFENTVIDKLNGLLFGSHFPSVLGERESKGI